MSRGGVAAALVGGALLGGIALTQPAGRAQGTIAPVGRCATIDVVSVFNRYEQTQDLNRQFDELRRRIRDEADRREQKLFELKRLLRRFNEDSPEYQQRLSEYQQEQKALEEYLRRAEEQVAREFRDWTERTYRQIVEAAGNIAAQQGFDLVLTTVQIDPNVPDAEGIKQQIRLRPVLWSNPAIDISEAVLRDLNLRYSRQPEKPQIRVTIEPVP